MDNLIDYEKLTIPPGSKWSKLSFIFALITFALFVWFTSDTTSKLTANKDFAVPSMSLFVFTQISCFLGVIFTILSFVKKERNGFMKWTGSVLNLLIVILMVGSVIFSKYI